MGRTGAPTTDAKAAIAGLITPLGGPKGSGLAIAFDIIAALLSGAATTPDLVPQSELARPQNVGHFFGYLILAKAKHKKK